MCNLFIFTFSHGLAFLWKSIDKNEWFSSMSLTVRSLTNSRRHVGHHSYVDKDKVRQILFSQITSSYKTVVVILTTRICQ